MKTMFELNPDYQEILRLDNMLSIAGIPHIMHRLFDGWKIVYIADGKEISDVVEHSGSYGNGKDLLEMMNLSFITGKASDEDEVKGWLSAYEVFKLWSADYRNRKK